MSLPVNSQIQVYHRLIRQPEGFIMEYSEIRTIAHEKVNLPGNTENPFSLSFELTFVMSLILMLPIFIYLAYRYGKKMGKKENSAPSSQSASPIIEKLTLSNKSTGETLSESDEAEDGAIVPFDNKKEVPPHIINSNKINPFHQEETGKQENLSFQLDPQIEEDSKDSQTVREKVLEKEKVLSFDNANQNGVIKKLNSEDKIESPSFNVAMKFVYDKDSRNNNIHQSLDDEKVQLHTHHEQISKKEVKVQLSFEKVDGKFQKIETQEIRTVYCEEAMDPETNAALLKQTYENYKDQASENSFLNLRRVKGRGSSLVPVQTPFIYHHIISSENKVLKAIECDNAVEGNTKSPEEAKVEDLQNLLEDDDLPHETGKFNKIFKNAQVIGQGSFGEVYKVVHKLDGKIYAVKKVKLAYGKFEDLQQKSKVFREVFAMTDLHHPNIVRYSTCWVEIEAPKPLDISAKVKRDLERDRKANEVVEELGSMEESNELESEASPSVKCSNASSMAFEWDLGGEESVKAPKTEKKAVKKRGQKFERSSSLMVKSLSKTLLEESEAPESLVSITDQSPMMNGSKLYLYIQMEYCAGENLRNFLDNTTSEMDSQKVLKMFRKILDGVNAIHQRGILHRDLKPANIFLDGKENVKIGDFGLASLDYTEEFKGPSLQLKRSLSQNSDKSLSMRIGTPMYSSPEQESGKRYNNKTDIYSLGLILSEMLANLSTHHERYQLFKSLRKNELPVEFRNKFARESELILKMTAEHPEERPNAESLIAEIDKLLSAGSSTS